MRALISRTLILHVSAHSPLSARASIISFSSITGEEASRRRTEPHSLTSSHSSHSQRRNYEEENRNVKVTVWWDFENCHVPVGVSVERIATRITTALRSTGIKGPITITAFGDVLQMSRATQEALTCTGVCLNHVPNSGKNSADRSFMADLVYWVTQNPPPAHFFLISGDKDFANILHRLRMSNYNILLATTDRSSSVLCSAATIMWPWTGMIKGENVTAKHFNHPPDGFYGSWYGQYKGVLDDPFLDSEQFAISQAEESVEQISKPKFRPVPMVVINGIRKILRAYPEGMYISELRTELSRRKIPLDKEYYGHKKLSDLLASLSNIVKFVPNSSGDGQPLVAEMRGDVSVETSSKPVIESDASMKYVKGTQTSKLEKSSTSTWDEKQLPVAPPNIVGKTPPPFEQTDACLNTGERQPIQIQNAIVEGGELGMTRSADGPTAVEEHYKTEVKDGLFRRIWMMFTGIKSDDSSDKKYITPKVDSASCKETIGFDHPKKLKYGEKGSQLKEGSSNSSKSSNAQSSNKSVLGEEKTLQSEEHRGTSQPKERFSNSSKSSSALGSNKSVPGEKEPLLSEQQSDTSVPRMGFFSQIRNWWQSWMYGAKDLADSSSIEKHPESDANKECIKDSTLITCQQEIHPLFSSSQFWNDLKRFLLTAKAADLILKSTTRDQLVHRMQKEGPYIFRDFKKSHLFELVELLISEKRWVKESATQNFPFKLVLPAIRGFTSSNGHGSTGLCSLFAGKTSQSNSQSIQEQGKQDSGSIKAKPPQNLAELTAWFQRTCNNSEDIKPEEFQKLFESKFSEKLVCSSYGYPTIRSLVLACSTGNGLNHGRKKLPPGREEILSDCHKLLTDLLKANPEGFNIVSFRPAFFEKYGYILDYQTLGYPKLVSLLQIMPGVKVESSFILPDRMFNSNSNQVADVSNGEDWEELGPVSDTSVGDYKSQTLFKNMTYSKVSLSDEEFTDSDDEAPSSVDASKRQPKREDEDSSVLQILDSWYSTQEGAEGKDQDQVADELVDCSKINWKKTSDLKPRSISTSVRQNKLYSFVAESGDDEKDKLVNSIIGSFKSTREAKLGREDNIS